MGMEVVLLLCLIVGMLGEEGGPDPFLLTEKNGLIGESFFFLTMNVGCNLLLYER